ncbi:probable disease resistance protein RF9 isoform X2 [Pistacia vera]|uniref:probable disease resistance protein RF9 isoform X2 n=1 Tax=Pistacia vera TaxID=55513 RepID=UPI0012636EAE|nr:probable disease resistance protein RF9 isoform X2 [Pistacia vera]
MSPSWMARLTKLRELTLYKCMNCEHLPPLGKLLSLESLSIWYMGGVKNVGNEFLGIGSGGTLSSSSAIVAFPKLKYLSINYMEEWEQWEEWNYKIIEEDVLIMPSLRFLQLNSCCKLKALPEYILQMTTLEELRIKYCYVLNLEKLWLSSYKEDIPLANMRMLTLDSCINVEYLPPLGKLSYLESIIIKRMGRVKRVDNEFMGIESSGRHRSITVFPKLKILVFENMDEWEEWDIAIGDEESTIMPSLQWVTIQCCNKLKGLPDHLLRAPRLEQLTINRCSILKERYRGEMGEDWTKISHIPNVQIHR